MGFLLGHQWRFLFFHIKIVCEVKYTKYSWYKKYRIRAKAIVK